MTSSRGGEQRGEINVCLCYRNMGRFLAADYVEINELKNKSDEDAAVVLTLRNGR